MKINYYIFLSFFLLIVIASIVVRKITKEEVPQFYWQIIETNKNNVELMDSIGGYKAYKFTYNEKEEERGHLNFEILIIGRTKNIRCKGIANKADKNWVVKEEECEIIEKSDEDDSE